MASERSCGTCRMCCKALSVNETSTDPPYEFSKPMGKMCEHASAAGCAIYHSELKPLSCTAFKCHWLMGYGKDEHRPDKMKVVLSVEEHKTHGILVIVYEAYPGITKSNSRVRRMIEDLWRQDLVDGIAIIEGPTLPRKLMTKKKGLEYAVPLVDQFKDGELTVKREDVEIID